jgi:hypothetical protein
MNVSQLKIEIYRQVESLDSSKLEEFYGIMLNYINSKSDTDEWFNVTKEEKSGIEKAIKELDAGKGIPHAQVMNNFRNKLSNG